MTRDRLQACDDLFEWAKDEATTETFLRSFPRGGPYDAATALYRAGFNDGWHHLRYLLRRAALDEQAAQ